MKLYVLDLGYNGSCSTFAKSKEDAVKIIHENTLNITSEYITYNIEEYPIKEGSIIYTVGDS